MFSVRIDELVVDRGKERSEVVPFFPVQVGFQDFPCCDDARVSSAQDSPRQAEPAMALDHRSGSALLPQDDSFE
jgi:hypothetical protein